MDDIRISIIIPAYNEVRYLPTCLEAIAAQTVKPFEVIVINNNSTDETVHVAKRYPFVRVIHESKQGIVFARNAGFNAARGDILARIDADTVLPPEWLTHVHDFYRKPENKQKILTGGCYFYNLRSGHVAAQVYDLIVHRINCVLLGYYFPWGANCVLPRNAWLAVKDDVCQRNDIHEDLDLGIHVHDAGFQTIYEPSLRVGALARRIMSDRGKLWPYLAMWPKTFQIHNKVAILVWPFALLAWFGSYGILVTEKFLSLFASGYKAR